MNNQQCINRRQNRSNLPAELVVEMVDCLPLENAAHFLASVPDRLIIHHCAPRIGRMLKMASKIAADYARTLPSPNPHGLIWLTAGHKYTPDMNAFLRYGAAHCSNFSIWRGVLDGTSAGFFGSPAKFFDTLIQYYYETEIPEKAVRYLFIELPLANPAPWPTALVQPKEGKMEVEELKVDNDWKRVEYILRNKHNPGIAFKLYIFFQGDAKCYQQMTIFSAYRTGGQ